MAPPEPLDVPSADEATDAEPDTYGPDEPLSVAEFAAHVALTNPDNVVAVELDEAEQRDFRRHQRRLLARSPRVRHLVASRVLPPRPRPRGARPAPIRRRGSRRSGRAPPQDDEGDPEPPGGLTPQTWRQTAGRAS
jgi:hypothetical protein